MNKTKRRLCILLILVLALAVCPIQAFAAGPIETDRNVVLNMTYRDGNTAIPYARFRIYKVADVDAYARMTLTKDFEGLKDSVTGLADLENLTTDEWSPLASTLREKALIYEFSPAGDGNTNPAGQLTFSNLKPGLYLVFSDRIRVADYAYTGTPFMIFLPKEDLKENEWNYTVSVEPKFMKEYDPPETKVSRKVVKVWNDAGYEKQRPAQVTVQLLQNGKVYDTQKLSQDNSWRYTWDNLDSDYEWDVAEEPVEGYTASVTRTGITVTITNTCQPLTPPDPKKPEEKLPQTGLLWWPVPMLLCAGLVFVTAGVIRRRSV